MIVCIRLSHELPVHPELHVHRFGLVHLPFTHCGIHIAVQTMKRKANYSKKNDESEVT